MIKKILLVFIFFLFINNSQAKDNIMILKLKDGDVHIELFSELAPKHVERFKTMVSKKKYDGVVFHRVIDGFMAQTGDVQFGNSSLESYDLNRAGTGGSEYPDLKAEFSELPHEKGTLSMARSSDPNSANSQFFICLKAAPHLDRQYTIFGKVIKGMEFVDLIKKGKGSNGEVSDPDKIISLLPK
jgi:peptidyl-prolyl cis-trans isomerase B (cyclophilin B)